MRKAVEHLKAGDPRLGRLIDRLGPFRMRYSPPQYCTLARSIVSQQLSSKAADTIYGRLEAAVSPGEVEAGRVLRLSDEQMRALGLSKQKSAYLRSLAEKTLDGTIEFAKLPAMPDNDVIEHLTSAKGVGVWTAHMFLIFALKRRDVLPVGDLGIRNAIHRVYGLKSPPTPKRIEEIGRPWRPYASVASWYLWRSLE